MEPLKYETEAPLERTWHVDVIDPLVLGEPAMLHTGQEPCRLSLGEDDAEVPKPLEQSRLAEAPSQLSVDLHDLPLGQSWVYECTLEHSLKRVSLGNFDGVGSTKPISILSTLEVVNWEGVRRLWLGN